MMKKWMPICVVGMCLVSFSAAFGGADTVRHAKEKVPNSYIVMLKAGQRAQDVGVEAASRYAGKLTATMPNLDMFAISLPSEAAANAIANDPRVLLVQEDGVLDLADCRPLDSGGSQWALTQINNPSETTEFGTLTGSYLNWVAVYVIDSRVNTNTSDFTTWNGYYNTTKVREVADFVGSCPGDDGGGGPYLTGTSINHGGAVASIIAGYVHGIAPKLNIINSIVAVDCLGRSTDAVLSASADYVIGNHQSGTPTIANVSIVSKTPDAIFDAAIKRMVDNGIFVVAAAGNDNADACSSSPAELGGMSRTPGFMAVGATNIYGSQARYSNYGTCVDIWAPGGETDPNNYYDKGVMTSEGAVTGTSFAAPHVAGAALVLFSRYPYWSAASVWSQIRSDSVNTWGRLILKIPTGCTVNSCAGWCPTYPQ